MSESFFYLKTKLKTELRYFYNDNLNSLSNPRSRILASQDEEYYISVSKYLFKKLFL